MSESDVDKAIQFFGDLSHNRLLFEQQMFISRKEFRANLPPDHSFKPHISTRNKNLALRSRSRKSFEAKESMLERLRKPVRDPEWDWNEYLKKE